MHQDIIELDFYDLYALEKYVVVNGNKTIELVGKSFTVVRDYFFNKKPNYNYVKAELAWYDSQALNIQTLANYCEYYDVTVPSIWQQIADSHNTIHSNYGYLMYGSQNNHQYDCVLNHLKNDNNSRQAVAIYTRPDIHYIAGKDMICTLTVQYLIRNYRLHVIVNMRSCDIIYGYRNDVIWQKHVAKQLIKDLWLLGIKVHKTPVITWNCGSLHIYEKHFYLLKQYKQCIDYCY